MTDTKALMLAAATVLSLGFGSAYAQTAVPTSTVPEDSWSAQPGATPPGTVRNPTTIQSGASDMGAVRTNPYALPFNGDYGDLANPG